ncbi:MAG: hypothetical protein O7G29_10570 [Acidobacteria bacterium]|nr:hypothetical protein [Acidobacteriota bacterium]
MDKNTLMNQLLSGGTALAGLILVFLGGIFTAYSSYGPEQQSSVRDKYKCRARMAFAGFACALASAVSAIMANWFYPSVLLHIGLAALGLSFVLVFVVAATALGDIS